MVVRSIAAEGYFFFLDEKEAKNQVGKKASLPHMAFTLQSRQNHRPESFTPLRSLCPRFCKISYVLATPQTTIVLPAFARSCFDDGERILLIYRSLRTIRHHA
jgi:hypothetical protein